MAILGMYEGHNAGAALISEHSGRVVAAVEEERFSRSKNHDSRPGADALPVRSVRWCLEQASRAHEPVRAIAIGLMPPELLQTRAWDNFTSAVNEGENQRMQRGAELGLDDVEFRHLPLRTQSTRVARAQQTIRLAGFDIGSVPHHFVEHHLCHAAAFLLSPVEQALVVTLDGKGDDLSGSVWRGEGADLRPILLIPTEDSAGHFYSAATVACDLRPQRDEGKLMAMAAHGSVEPDLFTALSHILFFDPVGGRIRSKLGRGIVQGPYPDRVASFHNDRMRGLIRGVDRADVARTVQEVLENAVAGLVRHHLAASETSTLVVSGGVFANVSLNMRLGRLDEVGDLHVHPGMTDSGIALGAAAWVYGQRHRLRPAPLEDLGIGPSYPDGEAVRPFIDLGYESSAISASAELQLARALARGHVVARLVGGCEYGPRALGFRSILAPATSTSALRELNRRLGRSQVMPFAPVVLNEWAHLLFADWEAVREPTRFMTTAVLTTELARRSMPAAVHHDGTARPQVVDPHHDPNLADLLTQYFRLSGVMGLVNTSFNLHDEPIVCTPDDAARSASEARIDIVQVGSEVLVRGSDAQQWVTP